METTATNITNEEERRDGSLSLRTDRLARDLKLGYTDFDHRTQLMAELKSLSKDEILKVYDAVFFGAERGRILVRGTGAAHKEGEPSKTCFGDDCVLPKLLEVSPP